MAAFEYQALDARGRKSKGVMEADNARHARQLLREQKLTPLSLELALAGAALEIDAAAPR